MKKIVYVDMDNVLVDFQSGIDRLSVEAKREYDGHLDDVPGIFSLMDPMPCSIEAVKKLSEHYDLYVLSTAPWKNISAWSDKVRWIQKHFGDGPDSVFYKRLIISHHKDLTRGDFLIDDRPKHGAEDFDGEWIQFGSERFPNWNTVTLYLLEKAYPEDSQNEPSPVKKKSIPWSKMTPEERKQAEKKTMELADRISKNASEKMRRGIHP